MVSECPFRLLNDSNLCSIVTRSHVLSNSFEISTVRCKTDSPSCTLNYDMLGKVYRDSFISSLRRGSVEAFVIYDVRRFVVAVFTL
jgi:hypothetical protein